MAARITDRELFNRVYANTHIAADVLSGLADTLPDDKSLPPELPADQLTELRNTLRSAFCAVQELRTRQKDLTRITRINANGK